MDDTTLVKVQGVSKKFGRDLRKSLWYGVLDIASELVGRPRSTELRKQEFWALDDISFSVKRGECLGLIGHNGSGKSTLLKILSGIIRPDKGQVKIRGNVRALIELGTGFKPILTGRENIYIYGALLGFNKKEIDRKFDNIVAFSELEDFVDTPIQNYSSGMKVRLGFAVASQMEPDVLLLDEVLAVGDVGFRTKCYNRIAELLQNSAVVLVSHSMAHIDRYCNKALLLSNGRLGYYGETKAAIERYFDLYPPISTPTHEIHGCELRSFDLLDDNGKRTNVVQHGGVLCINVSAKIYKVVKHPVAYISIHNRDSNVIAITISKKHQLLNQNGEISFRVRLSPIILNTGEYSVSLIIFDESLRQHLIWSPQSIRFKVTNDDILNFGAASIYFDGQWDISG